MGFLFEKKEIVAGCWLVFEKRKVTLHLFPLLNEVGCLGVGQGLFLSLIWVILRLVSIPILS